MSGQSQLESQQIISINNITRSSITNLIDNDDTSIKLLSNNTDEELRNYIAGVYDIHEKQYPQIEQSEELIKFKNKLIDNIVIDIKNKIKYKNQEKFQISLTLEKFKKSKAIKLKIIVDSKGNYKYIKKGRDKCGGKNIIYQGRSFWDFDNPNIIDGYVYFYNYDSLSTQVDRAIRIPLIDNYLSNNQFGLITCKKIIHDDSPPMRIRRRFCVRKVCLLMNVRRTTYISDLLKMDPGCFLKYRESQTFSYDREAFFDDKTPSTRPSRYYLKNYESISEDEFNKLKLTASKFINHEGLTFIYMSNYSAPRFILKEFL